VHESAPVAAVEDLIALGRELVTGFDRFNENRRQLRARSGISQAKLVGVFGLTSRVHAIAPTVLDAAAAQRGWAVTPLVRTAFECAVFAAWVEMHGEDGIAAMVRESDRASRALMVDTKRSPNIASYQDAIDRLEAKLVRGHQLPGSLSSQSRQHVFKDVDPSGELYLMYRLLSVDSHAGTETIEGHAIEAGKGAATELRLTKPGPRAAMPLDLHLLVLSLILSGEALDGLVVSKPRKAELARARAQASKD